MDISLVISLVSIASGTIISVCALWFSRRSITYATYDALDKMYWDLLRVGLEKPHLRNRAAVRNVEEQCEYEIYAHMAWCIVESIHDRAIKDGFLFDVWRSAMEIENQLHREWFDKDENRFRFRETFHIWVEKNLKKENFEVQPQQSTQKLMH